ncbi:LysR family transcriptional regulator [Streptomyces aidingensis]|uniref:DNA-binding transcriptional regulator, LysR family n=1 Tax=Streptomyces aidingensis TaxID=910347 RepID=A0A1I1J8N8_9ACTN|nr:LysR family transcriptional regulator [Streptomyces aidingensis]SFC42283.1 DNA-binding transcriptional regulator, LysR family [Streptomyces aidingensis]
MDLELRHLRIIRAIDDAGSLTRAATSLGLAQSALSAQLKRIERALGGPLFERGRHGARPTALGELVLDRARVLLPAVRELQEEAVRFANTLEDLPRFRLGGTHGPMLGGLVDALATTNPRAAISTVTSWSVEELSELVVAGRLDFAMVGTCGESTPPADDQLSWRTVGRDPIFVMLAEDHPLGKEPEIELGRLSGEQWVDAPGDGCFGDCFSAACARAGFTPASVYEMDTSACVHLVQLGRAVAPCRATFPPTPGIVTVPLAGTPLSWRHLLGWHPAAIAARAAPGVLVHARGVHREAARRNPVYARWLSGNARYGTTG